MNIQNMNLFNGDREKAINIAKIIKDKYDQSRKHTRDYSGLKAYFANELLIFSMIPIIIYCGYRIIKG